MFLHYNVNFVTFSTGNLICITILLCCRQRLNFAPAFANLLTLLSLFHIFTSVADQTRNTLNLKLSTLTEAREFFDNNFQALTFVNYSAPTLSSHFKAYYSPAVIVTTYPFLQVWTSTQFPQITQRFRLPSPAALIPWLPSPWSATSTYAQPTRPSGYLFCSSNFRK